MKAIPQFEIPFADDHFTLVSEKGLDSERIEAMKRTAEETARAAKEFHAEHQITLV